MKCSGQAGNSQEIPSTQSGLAQERFVFRERFAFRSSPTRFFSYHSSNRGFLDSGEEDGPSSGDVGKANLCSIWSGVEISSPELTVPPDKDKDLPLSSSSLPSRVIGTVLVASHIS